MAQSNELRVFISSTFRDLQEEREHLVKKIFPEIRALCRERGVTFTEVDLRWGLTEEQATLGTVIRTCLEEVDKCRPYFIGLLGSRYGWVPNLHEVMIDPDLLTKYPWVEEAAINGTSLTEMEFIHGVFNAADGRGDYAYFYHRPLQTTGADDPEKLSALVERVRQGGYPLLEFSSAEELGQLVHDDLLGMIERYWPEDHQPGRLEIERRSHAAFSGSRRRAYIPNPEHLKEFNRWLNDGTTPLVVSAESGLGKSALAAYLTEAYRVKHPGAVVIEHYVGSSEQSGSALSLVRHVVEEIRERYAITEELPTDPQKLLEAFPNWLWRLGHLARERGEEVLVVLDALNQLDEAGRRLTWLPPIAPENLKLLVTLTPGDALEALRKRGWQEFQLVPIDDERVRQSIVLRYLGEFHKGIAPDQLRRITSDRKAHSPLYLRVVAEELRLHGEHETLAEVIEHYVTADDLDEVFQQVLERMERDYGAESVREMLSLVWCSRSGLSETELLELTGSSRMELSRLLFALDYHLLHRDGLLGFFHDYLRRAVEKRYLHDDAVREQRQMELAQYFEGMALTRRSALELLWQYRSDAESGDSTQRDGKMSSTLARPAVLLLLYQGETRFEMLMHWTQLIRRGYNAGEEYRRSLSLMSEEEMVERGEVLVNAAGLLVSLSEWKAAEDLFRDLVDWGRAQEQEKYAMHGELGAGSILLLRGECPGALERFEEALRLALQLNDHAEMALIIGRMGTVHFKQGRYAEAMEGYGRQLAISEELGDRVHMSSAINDMGGIHYVQGRYPEAMECYVHKLAISEELGDRGGMSLAIGNMGHVHYGQGRYAEAMECFVRKLAICEELGDRSGMSYAIGNMGNTHYQQGRHSEAMECFVRKLAVCEELGDRSGMSLAIGTMGLIHQIRGRYAEAMECYGRQLAISKELGDRRGMSLAIGWMGLIHQIQRRYAEAMECYAHDLEISKELGDRNGMTRAIGNMGSVHLDQGELAEAMECYGRQLAINEEIGDRVGIALAIGHMGSVHEMLGEYDRALECLVQAAREFRAIGSPGFLAEHLEGSARVLLTLVVAGEPMPEFLPAYVPGARHETWQPMSLECACEQASECVMICRDLSRPDMQFNGELLLARIEAAQGRREATLSRLHTMLDGTTDDERHADIQYWLWKFSESKSGHRSEALRLYQHLIETNPHHEYRSRIDELTAVTNSPEINDATE